MMIEDLMIAHLRLLYKVGDVFLFLVLLVLGAGALIARFEKLSFGESIYFAFITAFTVGFGDITPKSPGARIVAVFLAFLGLVLMGFFVAVASQALDVVYSEFD